MRAEGGGACRAAASSALPLPRQQGSAEQQQDARRGGHPLPNTRCLTPFTHRQPDSIHGLVVARNSSRTITQNATMETVHASASVRVGHGRESVGCSAWEWAAAGMTTPGSSDHAGTPPPNLIANAGAEGHPQEKRACRWRFRPMKAAQRLVMTTRATNLAGLQRAGPVGREGEGDRWVASRHGPSCIAAARPRLQACMQPCMGRGGAQAAAAAAGKQSCFAPSPVLPAAPVDARHHPDGGAGPGRPHGGAQDAVGGALPDAPRALLEDGVDGEGDPAWAARWCVQVRHALAGCISAGHMKRKQRRHTASCKRPLPSAPV